jgi:hypothetical protein
MSYVIIVGDPLHGFRVVGPFDRLDEATWAGEKLPHAFAWWVTELWPTTGIGGIQDAART